MKQLYINSSVLSSFKKVYSRYLATSVLKTKGEALKSFKEIPGPSCLPLIGPFHHFLPGGSLHDLNGYKLCEHLYKKYGPLVRVDGGFKSAPSLFVFDPDTIAHILHSENWLPERFSLDSLEYFRKKYNKKEDDKSDDRSTGLLTEQGERWKTFRSAVNPVMMQPKTIKLYEKPIDEVALEMIDRLRSLRNEKNTITEPFDFEMNKWALESIGVIALGGRIGCLRSDLPPDSPAWRLIQCVHDVFDVVYKLDDRPHPWRLIATPDFKKAMQLYQDLVDFTKYFIHDAIKKLKEKNLEHAEDQKGVLEKLLEVDEDVAIKMAMDMLFAGVDTTAQSMINVLYLLAVNPEKQIKLREEILSKDEHRRYLKACIKESMRVLPIVFINLRMLTKEYNINGYLVPKGVNCLLANEYISKQEDQYERPTDFIPERWTELAAQTKARAHPHATMPFGFGARSCIGRRIAELEIETLLYRVIENFHVEWVGPPLKQKTTKITYGIGPYKFIFKDVN